MASAPGQIRGDTRPICEPPNWGRQKIAWWRQPQEGREAHPGNGSAATAGTAEAWRPAWLRRVILLALGIVWSRRIQVDHVSS